MKFNRQNEIMSLIGEYEIETQEDLSAKLAERGYQVTQATISRDIREMRLVKIAGSGGRYKYAIPHHEPNALSLKFKNLLTETVIGVDSAGNIAVVKTYAGMAQGAAAAIDAMGHEDIVGSVAGDDTILIVMRTPEKARALLDEVRAIISSKV